MTATASTIIVDNIPTKLRQRDQWAGFIWAMRHGRRTKIPINPRTGNRARTNDPTTWGTFDEAIAAVDRYGLAGAGYIFAKDDPYFGVDVDGCRDPETGDLDERGQRVLDLFEHTYWEVSPSGTGIKGIGRGRLPITDGRTGRRHTGQRIEVYQERRFWAITGQRLDDTSRAITDCQAQVDHLFAVLFPPRSAPSQPRPAPPSGTSRRTDEAVITRIRESPQRAKLDALMAGAAGDNWSSADQSLCNILAFWTRDAAQIERIWSRSALANRDKFKRADYRTRTITSALDWITEYYIWPEDIKFGKNGSNSHADASGGNSGDTSAEAPPAPRQRPCTDLGNAERLVDHHGRNIRYCHDWGQWLVWDDQCWAADNTGAVERLAAETVRTIYQEAAVAADDDDRKRLGKWATTSESRARIRDMVALAASRPRIPVTPAQLDADPWLLCVDNGTVDLRTGQMRDHQRRDLLTKLAPVEYDPAAACPQWLAFLRRIMADDEEMIRFLQRAAGYSLTGDVSERKVFIAHGTGANGKSTFLETLSDLLGDYAMRTPTETLMAKRDGAIPNDVARLKGARFVYASEAEEGKRLAEAFIKDVTSGDTMTARFMRGEFFEFKPVLKLWLGTNHKPIVRGTDEAIWDRICLIPFTVRIPEAERVPRREMMARLRSERAGILAWAIQGCLEWQRVGLQVPDQVRGATAGYRAEMDVIADFLADRCVVQKSAMVKVAELYSAYAGWCETSGERAITQRALGMRLIERGFVQERRGAGGKWHWVGVGLGTADDQEEGEL